MKKSSKSIEKQSHYQQYTAQIKKRISILFFSFHNLIFIMILILLILKILHQNAKGKISNPVVIHTGIFFANETFIGRWVTKNKVIVVLGF
jgi:hypothetical protein